VPLCHDSVIDIHAAHLQVGALHRILNDIEEKRVVEDLQILEISVSCRSLCVCLKTPEQLTFDCHCMLREHRQQLNAIGRESRIALEKDWQPYLDEKIDFNRALADLVRDAL
jgi:hypothetical protein